jgi:hypothetical protein
MRAIRFVVAGRRGFLPAQIFQMQGAIFDEINFPSKVGTQDIFQQSGEPLPSGSHGDGPSEKMYAIT